LIDNKKTPNLESIYFYLTEGCNLACKHCWINPPLESESLKYGVLRIDLLKKAIEEAMPLGLRSIKLTGGEPFLHPQIVEIIKIIKQYKLNAVIESNGTLIDRALARRLSEIESCFISISIDSTNPEIHDSIRNQKGSFDKSIKGIKLLVENGVHPQVIASLLPENKTHISEIIKYAEELGASSFKLNIVQPTARGEKLMKKGGTVDIPEIIEIAHRIHNTYALSSTFNVFVCIPFAFRPLQFLYRGDSGRCGIKSIIGVLSNGQYALCGIGASMPELIFGNIETDNLADVWENNKTLLSLRTELPDKLEGVCRNCLMKWTCLGSCVAQNYYAKAKLNASFWFCESANDLNLFPSSRLIHPTSTNKTEI
jgi:SynChlorMet cassette radical SAM/SPASM protein ScmF